ncbi:UxaA family hydrolase [Anaerospora hongkongensis]|uniref:UxaA family hydrolase n=1 Tax=Anaerospora hongkongensis TaxID=244830 RepID=UPI00289F0F1F|nr:altronate dehydratase family protein [Anaerospora hongkongensis]
MAPLKIHEADNVAVLLEDVKAGAVLEAAGTQLIALESIDKGHKIALTTLTQGEAVIKYGFPIGHATTTIPAGSWVHTHNVRTNLGDVLEYDYQPAPPLVPSADCRLTFQGYRRENGRAGVRNEVWIIPTVSCVNRTAQLLAKWANEELAPAASIDGVYEYTHPYGCSQLGEDHAATQSILSALVNHPNAGAVLVLGLGCENNNVAEFKKVLGEVDDKRVKFLVAQEVSDEFAAGQAILQDLVEYAGQYKRTECSARDLVIGLKCGGSDGFSGITGNPLVGAFSDRLVACGGSSVLTEVPEMFGAETLLMNRAKNKVVFEKIVALINNFKAYFASYHQPVYENPSPGNKKGGITTLEEKSLGCTQKGGRSIVSDVLQYGQAVSTRGLNLLNGPGNDAVATTALAAAGCQIVLFTTGRGTPLGTAVPTVKIATNSDLFQYKANWMDFDAGAILTGKPLESVTDELSQFILAVASGQQTKAEKMGFREIAIFKNGVTL